MFLWIRSLFRFTAASERHEELQARLKAESLAENELAREARGQNYLLEQMLRETQAAKQPTLETPRESRPGAPPSSSS